ncbi:uncharacterized protein LOC130135135 isoform X1 [Syzygium oleosum]|uniref:uncharacterized protein LOC130135135 isoform X1 n=1 Tax=Syzygium oleosum TaxID=219896 RepID=UPI0024B93E48|nr:uncharacterized protein LOC130135135 isoform X1 [Syzygium oleosum]
MYNLGAWAWRCRLLEEREGRPAQLRHYHKVVFFAVMRSHVSFLEDLTIPILLENRRALMPSLNECLAMEYAVEELAHSFDLALTSYKFDRITSMPLTSWKNHT